MPLLTQEKAEWPDRTLVTHVGRWQHGKAAEAKIHELLDPRRAVHAREQQGALRSRGRPRRKGERHRAHPEAAAKLRAAYDKWWDETVPLLVNEERRRPKMNPFKESTEAVQRAAGRDVAAADGSGEI